MVVIQGEYYSHPVYYTCIALHERLRRYEIASFVCLAAKITQEVTDMPNIHFHHSR